MMDTFPLPPLSRDSEHVGFRMMIGIGALAVTNAQVAWAWTSEVGCSVIREAKVSLTRS
jgi:hypothetical protein